MPVDHEEHPTGPVVRELRELAEFDAVVRLVNEIWGVNADGDPVSAEMMRALSHAGNYVAGAYQDGRLVGASVAFFAAPVGTSLHSHLTGASGIGRGVGLALKLHQRDWALARGLTRITWTYDPLVRRNAYFNLVKLGARPVEYLPSFYGAMDDAINGGDDSDRVLAAWDIAEPLPGEAPSSGPVACALRDRDGRPEIVETAAETVLIELPADIETLRHTDPNAARAWRLALREVLGGLLANGARVAGFHDRAAYVVDRAPTTRPSADPSSAEEADPSPRSRR
ncbi:GNAT family N-acetyltransferase [Spirillospora sp. NPDC052269]